MGQGGVPAVLGRVRVAAGFDRSGVVARGEHNGGDAVHDALVVRRGTIRIRLGERARGDDVVDHLRAAEQLGIEHCPRAGEAQLGLVGEDAQQRARAGDLSHAGGQRLRHRVDGVGAHRVAHIDMQVQDHLPAGAGLEHAHRDVPSAAAEPHEDRVLVVGQRQQFVPRLQQAHPGRLGIDRIEHLDLGDHDVAGVRGVEAPVPTRDPRGVRRGRDHARFLGGHGDQAVLCVDDEVHRDTHRHGKDADHVLDHVIGLVE